MWCVMANGEIAACWATLEEAEGFKEYLDHIYWNDEHTVIYVQDGDCECFI